MNKKICMCAAAALALASCSNDELVEVAKNDAINFRTVVGLNTKATEIKTADLETKGVYVTTFDAAGNLLFGETHYTKQADGTFSASQYWGNNASLDFYLTLPKLSEWVANASLTDTNKKLVGVTVKDKIADQVDLVAVAKTSVTKTADAINVELQHVLSQIEIKAKNGNDNYVYKVKGVRINNVSNKADIDLSSNSWSNVSAEVGNIKSYEVKYATSKEITLGTTESTLTVKEADGTTVDNAMLIPQGATTAWNGTATSADGTTPVAGTYISVLVNITAKNGGAAVYPKGSTTAVETYGWVAVPVAFTWEKGNKYIYTLDFTNGAGKVDPVNPGPDVRPGTTDPGKAEPVLGDEIKFTVTVKEWTPQTEIKPSMN
mgnify:CR=1 FL=1